MEKTLLSILLAFPLLVSAQEKDYSPDVKSVDSIIKVLYEVISGEAEEPRDWNRFKNLFTADARFIPTFLNKESKVSYKILTPDDYVTMFANRMPTGFFERELHRETEEYGTIVHVFSTYETKETKAGEVTNRGINSIQLLKTNDRYYVMNIFWCAESSGYPLPDKYLD